MDIVYICKHAQFNEELRYSLRSLKNLPHDRVWISGYKPRWVRNVEHISVEQWSIGGEKYRNSARNQKAALTHPDISDPYILFNDDFFVMKPLENFPVLTWGLVDDVIEHMGTERLGAQFHTSMIFTRKIMSDLGFTDPISYQLHAPLLIHKQPFLDAMDLCDRMEIPKGVWPQHATIYGNVHGIGGQRLERDVKVHGITAAVEDWMRESVFLSTNDQSFAEGNIGSYIRDQFPEPGMYEAH